jgi:salicylate hydroxylase
LAHPHSPVLIAGAGIGGLAAALALARRGIAVTLFEQAERLEETGAGIQLPPNATRILIDLGLEGLMAPAIATPTAIRLRAARSGRDIAVMPLAAMTARHGAPYWVIHRADLQRSLLLAAKAEPRITLTLGAKVEDFAAEGGAVRAFVSAAFGRSGERTGSALIGADGVRSTIRFRLGDKAPPRFAGRTAWRVLVDAVRLPPQFADPAVNLWIGASGHVVHYPVRSGAAINVVAVGRDRWQSPAWSAPASCEEVRARFPRTAFGGEVQELLAAAQRWQKWALCDRAPSPPLGDGPVTLLGDAAHPMLPYLAQGAAMAIEDATVLAREFERKPADPAAALRHYEAARAARTALVQRAARGNDLRYHLGFPANHVRDALLGAIGGERLLANYDWLFGWRA